MAQLAGSAEVPLVLSPGTELGKYRLIRRIAVGGMAELYLARVTGIEGFEKLVALKRILPNHAGNELFVKMFLDEARLAATLHHANIAQVFDIGMEKGCYFFAMEYVHGEDVLELLRACHREKRALPLDHAVNIVLGTAAGLHYAHEKRGPDGRPLGIVHRDISPSNVLVTYDGGVKLVDFGVAKASSHRAESRVGTLKGKIAYMSPEQCAAAPLDRRSDVFSLGIVLYELTTGLRLFQGDNELVILNQIVNRDAEPPSVRRPGYPKDLEAIVMRALKREPSERYATTQDLQLDLEAFARDQKLAISPIGLARFMEDLFGAKVEAFREAQSTGTLARHLAFPPAGSLAGEASDTRPEPSLQPPQQQRSRAWLWVLAVVGVLAIAAGAWGIGASMGGGGNKEQATKTAPPTDEKTPVEEVAPPPTKTKPPVDKQPVTEPRSTPPVATTPTDPTPVEKPVEKPVEPVTATTVPQTEPKAVLPARTKQKKPKAKVKPVTKTEHKAETPKADPPKKWDPDSALPP